MRPGLRVGGVQQPQGKQADVVQLRGDRPGLANVHDPPPAGLLMLLPRRCGRRLVDGVRRVADGRLVDHDPAALVEASRPLAAELVTRAGLGRYSRLARLPSSAP